MQRGAFLEWRLLAFYRSIKRRIRKCFNIKRPIIYKMIVNDDAVKKGRWLIISVVPLEEELKNTK